MPSVVFAFGDSSKEVDLKDINSVDDVASNMKEVTTTERLDRQENWRAGYDVLTEGALGDYPEE